MKNPDDSTPKKKPAKKSSASTQPAPPSLNNAANAKPKRKISADRARDRLIKRHGYEKDELDKLFKTDEALVEFYHEVATVKATKETEDEIGWDDTDNFDIPAEEKSRLTLNRLEKEKARFEAAGGQSPVQNEDAAAIKEPVVSFDDFLKAGNELDDLLKEGNDLLETDEGDKEEK